MCACGTGRGSLVFAWGGSRVAVRRSGVQSRVDSSGRQRRRSLCAREGKITNPRTSARSGLKKAPTHLFFFFLSKKFLLRFCVFLGMGNPETAKKLFWKFFGHDPKSHLMTQKIFFLGTCSVRSWPYYGHYRPPRHHGPPQSRLNRPWGCF